VAILEELIRLGDGNLVKEYIQKLKTGG